MFHRRLALLMAVFVLATTALGGQLYRLTIVEGPRYREEAERALEFRRLIPTTRGDIVDRKGRVLATDRPCHDIAVQFEVITGEWAYKQALALARRDHADEWPRLSFEQRERRVAAYQVQFDRQLDQVWATLADLGGLDSAELERRKRTVIRRVQAIRSHVMDRRREQREEELGKPVELAEVVVPLAEERDAHTLLPAVDIEVANQLTKLVEAGRLPGVEIVRAKSREYLNQRFEIVIDLSTLPSPLRRDAQLEVAVEQVAERIIGTMRDVWAEDVDPEQGGRPYRRADGSIDLAGYLPGDRTGSGGVERAAEDLLRGRRGVVITRRDTGEQTRTSPEPGKAVQLTIDVQLQARLRAIMDPRLGLMQVQPFHLNEHTPTGTPLYGAALVMEVDSGEILAMVSTPTPAREGREHAFDEATLDRNQAEVNKPIAAVYPPGSTLKPIIYAIAAARKAIAFEHVIECNGHLLEHAPGKYRCWGWRPEEGRYIKHGPLGPVEAIARSCNIFFYTCARHLGAETIVRELRRFGFGERAGIGLPEEVAGLLPSVDGPNRPGRALNLSNAIMLGIGQGPIAVPPVQVAAAHAALARGGYYVSPILLRHQISQQQTRELHIPAPVIQHALDGMLASANESYGTGHHLRIGDAPEPIFSFDDLIIRSKTGTAQAPAQFEDLNDNRQHDEGEPILRDGSHSWYIAHVARPGEDRARYIVVVMAEYGGSGGRVSGPVTNQIVHALKAEGYLD